MSIAITDPALLAQLSTAAGSVELRDPSGNIIGRFVQRRAAPCRRG